MGTRRWGGEGKEPASKRNRVRFNALIIKHPEGKKNAVKRSTLRGQSGVTNQQNSLRPFRLVLFLSLSLSFLFPFSSIRFRRDITNDSDRKYVKQSGDDLLLLSIPCSQPPTTRVPASCILRQPLTYIQPGFTRDIFVLKSRIPVPRRIRRSRPIAWFVLPSFSLLCLRLRLRLRRPPPPPSIPSSSRVFMRAET